VNVRKHIGGEARQATPGITPGPRSRSWRK